MTIYANATYQGSRYDGMTIDTDYFQPGRKLRYGFTTHLFSNKVTVFRVRGHDTAMDAPKAVFPNALEFAAAFGIEFEDVKGFWD